MCMTAIGTLVVTVPLTMPLAFAEDVKDVSVVP